ncbi:MAG TPA: hypothetical protein VIV60_29635, partial [Polyangiaceae bacterium]
RIRIHSSGDFFSLEYLRAWQEVARRNPGITFFTYTRTWIFADYRAALAECPPNMIVLWSTDPSMPDPRDIGRTDGISWINVDARAPLAPNCLKQATKHTNNPRGCNVCGICTRGRSVCLIKH